LERTRRYYAEKIIAQFPYATKEGLQAVIEDQAAISPASGSVNVDRLIDNSFLTELERSAFVQTLSKK
jgi:hypothetical protein